MSTLRVDTIQDRAGTGNPAINGLAKAWVNFDGTGTVAIRASWNVTSITDNGTGDYTVNFTSAMPDANYVMTGATHQVASTSWGVSPSLQSSSAQAVGSVRISTISLNGAANGLYDYSVVSVAIFR